MDQYGISSIMFGGLFFFNNPYIVTISPAKNIIPPATTRRAVDSVAPLVTTTIIWGSLLENEIAAYFPLLRFVKERLVMPVVDEFVLGKIESALAADWVMELL